MTVSIVAVDFVQTAVHLSLCDRLEFRSFFNGHWQSLQRERLRRAAHGLSTMLFTGDCERVYATTDSDWPGNFWSSLLNVRESHVHRTEIHNVFPPNGQLCSIHHKKKCFRAINCFCNFENSHEK